MSDERMRAALTRAIHRAAYIGIDHVDRDTDTSEVGYLDSKGQLVDVDGGKWVVTVEPQS